jgi:hypothetical protein
MDTFAYTLSHYDLLIGAFFGMLANSLIRKWG